MSTVAPASNEWRAGGNNATIPGTTVVSDIDAVSYQNIVDPLDRLLSNYREGAELVYDSAAQVTMNAGEVVCSNAAGTIRKMRQNTSNTTVTWADIDTGAEAGSTYYYVYAVCDADATTFTATISTNSATPTGATYYQRLGQFYNNASSNISAVQNDNVRSVVATGTAANGGTISVPSGWSADECDWTVGLGDLNDIAGYGANDEVTVTVNSSRVVTCTYNQTNWVDGVNDYSGTCTANYIIACYR